jgi:hypothetical protein
MSRLRISFMVAALIAMAVVPTIAQAGTGALGRLAATTGQGSGLIKLATTADDVVGPGTFDVQGTINVNDANPGTTFAVLRRVDFTADGICTSSTWLPLPPPNAPALTTSAGGAGALHFEISKGSPLLDGVLFDVQWRLAGDDGSVLESQCFTVSVK